MLNVTWLRQPFCFTLRESLGYLFKLLGTQLKYAGWVVETLLGGWEKEKDRERGGGGEVCWESGKSNKL